MKVKRKYKQGDRVDSVAELLEHDWFIVHFGPRTTKTMHKAVLWEWKLKTCQQAIDSGRVFIAVKLTNGEYYGDMTDDQIVDMLETDLCEYPHRLRFLILRTIGNCLRVALAMTAEELF